MNRRTRRRGGGITRASLPKTASQKIKARIAKHRLGKTRRGYTMTRQIGTVKPFGTVRAGLGTTTRTGPLTRSKTRAATKSAAMEIVEQLVNHNTTGTAVKPIIGKSKTVTRIVFSNNDMKVIDPAIASAMALRDQLLAELNQPSEIGRSNKFLRADYKKLMNMLKILPKTDKYPKGSENRKEIGLMRQQCSQKDLTAYGKFNILAALKRRGIERSAAGYGAEESAHDPEIDALIAGIEGL